MSDIFVDIPVRVALSNSNSADDFNQLMMNLRAVLGQTSVPETILSLKGRVDSAVGNTLTVLKTSSYTVTDSDNVKRIESDTTSGDNTYTLPLMANNRGRRIEIANIKGGTNKVIIVPNATDANKLSNDGLNAIWLPNIGDFVVFQESVNSGYWEIVNERITSQLRLNTYAGYGSTDTKIMRFTNVVENVGNMFSENHVSGYSGNAKGLEITINRSGRYGISYDMAASSGSSNANGLSINSNQLTTNIYSITASNVLNIGQGAVTTAFATCTVSMYIKKGDIVRAHADGGVPYGSAAHFVCSYLGN